MNAHKVVVAAFSVAIMGLSAAEYTVKDGTTNWASESSYEPTGLPGAGDVVKIPANATVTLSSADAASVAQFKKLSRVVPMSEASTLILDFATDDELPVSITAWEPGSKVPRLFRFGPIVKKGAGTLHLSACNDALVFPYDGNAAQAYYINDIAAGDYFCGIRVEEGALKVQQGCARSQMKLGMVTVMEDAAFFLPNSETDGRVVLTSIAGSGLITNTTNNKTQLSLFGTKSDAAATFSGRIDGTFKFGFRGDAQTLDGDFDFFMQYPGRSGCVDEFRIGYTSGEKTEIGVKSIGSNGKASSFGFKGKTSWGSVYGDTPILTTSYSGLTLHYLGTGETVNRGFRFARANGDKGPFCILDAGAYGGLNFVAPLVRMYNTNGGQRLVLCGSNETESVISGEINDSTISDDNNGRGYPLYITKEGTGTWRLAAVGRPKFASGISVDEGVLQYESIAPKGTVCSVGVATNLTDGTTGWPAKDSNHRVSYAIRLGGKTSSGEYKDSGRFEYAGSTPVSVSDREIAVAGTGGLRANGTAAQRFSTIYGISAEAMTLVLDGSSTADNEINNVSDGTGGGKLSVTKDGTGKWILSGEQSWSGDLTVKDGELVIRNPSGYSWYDWTVTSLFYPGEATTMDIAEFCLCEADGTYLTQCRYENDGSTHTKVSDGIMLVDVDQNHQLQPGQARMVNGAGKHFSGDNARVFDNKGYAGDRYKPSPVPLPDDPKTWLSVVMRLPQGKSGAAGYDYANGTGSTGGRDGAKFCVSNYFIRASLDGFNWQTIKTVSHQKPANYYYCQWAFSQGREDSYYLDKHVSADGSAAYDPLPVSPEAAGLVRPNMLGNVSSVSVRKGAKLTLEAGSVPVTIKELKIDAMSGGTISGFEFAANGTVSVENVTDDTRELPLTVSGSTTFENVADWSLTVNGKAKPGWSISAKGGKLTLLRPGIVLIVR